MKSRVSRANVWLIALLALGISGCATTLKSTVDTAEHADLTAFKTYAWIPSQSLASDSRAPALINPINGDRIRASIDAELQRKGYRRVSLAEADLAVAFTLGARDRIRIRNDFDRLGYRHYGFYPGFSRFGFYGPRFGSLGTTTSVRTFTEGTLVVDIFDNRQREALWHGAASKRLSTNDNGDELIPEAVATLLGQFPDRAMMSKTVKDLMTDELAS